MSTLAITKAYAAGNALLEAHLDNFRTGLHTLFNTDKFSNTSFGALDLTADKFLGGHIIETDNTGIDFGLGLDASFGLDVNKNFVFNTAAATTIICFYATATYYIEFTSTKLNVPGDIILADGGASRTVLQALSVYKKPVLEWSGSTSVTLQQNSGTTDETVIFFPEFVVAVTEAAPSKYRFANITATAHGYATTDTGAAKGGRRNGITLTDNRWYAVYAVKVRAGTDFDADAFKFILVFDDLLPTQGNETTLNGHYGSNSWVYMGMVRYGYGDDGSGSEIIKFKQSNKGWCYFHDNSSGTALGGLVLEHSTSDSDNTSSAFHTLASGTSGQVIPNHISHVALMVSREKVSDWYIKDSNSRIIWRPGWQTDDSSFPHGYMIELPFIEYGIFQERKGTGSVSKDVTLIGFCDGYLALRRHGHGI